MGIITAVSRYILPSVALILLFKCIITLLLGHPKEKTYAYITDLKSGERHPLNMWETSLGRGRGCDIVVRYATVSRVHAVISRRIDGWYVYDLDSKSGIKVNGLAADKKAMVTNGDKISLAEAEFRFEIVDDPVQHAGKHKKKSVAAVYGQYAPRTEAQPQMNTQGRSFYQPRMINMKTGETFVLIGNIVCVGSAQKNDIRVRSRGVSGCHCELVLYQDGWVIIDCRSTNGTLLNGRRITAPQLLFDGDVITLGTEKLCFKIKVN